MPRKIAIAAIIVALLGLYSDLMFVSGWKMSTWHFYLKDFFSSLNLGYMNGENRFDTVNYLNLFFYSLLLTGGIIYFFSRKETRLVRYVLSMILLSKAIRVFFMVIYLPFSLEWLSKGFNSVIMIGYLVWHLLWVWLCWKALTYFRETKEIAVTRQQYGDLEQDIISESSRWQRLFNLIVDSSTFIFIFFPVVESLVHVEAVRDFLRPLENTLGERLGLYFICIILQVIYYMLFEGFLQASPGKMLTETRVVTDTAGKPATGKLFVRTIVRFVPFESLSVLFGRGWHDDWSDTYVVREKREGVNGGWYFFIFPAFVFLGVTGYLGYKSYEKHQIEVAAQEKFELNRDRLQQALKHLAADDFITIGTNLGGTAYLKIEEMKTDAVVCTIIDVGSDYGSSKTLTDIESIYNESGDELRKITLTKKELEAGIVKEYVSEKEYSYNNKPGAADLLKNGAKCHIENISKWLAPEISLDNMYLSKTSDEMNTLTIDFTNNGWEAELIAINSKGKAFEWYPKLPVTVTAASGYGRNLSLNGNSKEIDEFEADLTFKDTLGRIQVFNIKGSGPDFNDAVMKRIK